MKGSFEVIGPDDAPTCEDGVCALPSAVPATSGTAESKVEVSGPA